MPELPEVEITRRRIAPLLVGRRIAQVRTTRDSYFYLTRPRELRRGLVGRSVDRLDRQGKYLIGSLDDGQRLLVHLGMTGQLFGEQARSVRLLSSTARASLAPHEQVAFEPDEHTHLHISFEDGHPDVFMRDVRKFGKVGLIAPGVREPRIEKLGVDALEASGPLLFAATRKRKVAIKTLLLDQKTLAGVGNIYADEALFGAGVRPSRRACRVTRDECKHIASEIRRVLTRSIETGGASISDFVGPDGADGAYQDERRVYARTAEPCPECGTLIKKIVLGARGTHYCPACQR